MTETKLPGMVINRIDSEDTYQKLVAAGQIGENDISFVESEDTSVSLGITGANVGDIIKVKSVDGSGKPTKWETANIDEFDVHYKTNITEALTEGFSITSVNDTPLKLKEMWAMVKFANGGENTAWCGCNILAQGLNINAILDITAGNGGENIGAGAYFFGVYHVKLIGGRFVCEFTTCGNNLVTANVRRRVAGEWQKCWLDYNNTEYISGIQSNSNLAGANDKGYGTEIEIWGKSI